MSELKNFASLSPTLLARKGGARPAMRQQFANIAPDILAAQGDDLGWNDHGDDDNGEPYSAEIVQLLPDDGTVEAGVSAVIRRRLEAARLVTGSRRSALADGRRAAFTLRVDAERHLKLRLACSLRNRSAQQLVTEALDQLIDTLPDVATLTSRLAARPRKS